MWGWVWAGEPGAAACWLSLTPRRTQEALTPGHLKKAKLMFFFTRYPSSALLRSYFLDVQVAGLRGAGRDPWRVGFWRWFC